MTPTLPGKQKMTSFLRSISDRFSGGTANGDATAPREDGFHTATSAHALFTKTQVEVDGEECLHDCDSCTIKYPRKFEIEEDDKLYGEIKGWSRHLIVATGKTDWVRDVEDEKGSVMEAVGKHMSKHHGKLMLSASNIPLPDDGTHHDGPYGADRPTTVLLMPAFRYVDNVTPNAAEQLIGSVINVAPTNTTLLQKDNNPSDAQSGTADDSPQIPIQPIPAPPSLPAGLTLRACPHKAIILLCSQATRDARCGQSAPLLRRELERHLRPLGLYRDLHDERPGGVGIYFISHVGGHKYSANMLVYRRAEPRRSVVEQIQGAGKGQGEGGNAAGEEAAQCIWLARIRPEDCENVVRFTVLQGKVVKPERQLRGGFDREKGVVSW